LKNYTKPLMKKDKKTKKSFEFYYDNVSERYVWDVKDVENIFPLLLKTPVTRTYEIILSRHNTLNMR
jgi:hypothetical protein